MSVSPSKEQDALLDTNKQKLVLLCQLDTKRWDPETRQTQTLDARDHKCTHTHSASL